jgi:hypothetical protein
MDLTILLSVAGLDIALSLRFMHSCCMICSEKLVVNLYGWRHMFWSWRKSSIHAGFDEQNCIYIGARHSQT